MNIFNLEKNNQEELIKKAVEVLKTGGLVVYPTETCYGLGADATNQKAIDKLLSYKRRREGKPLSILVTDKKMADKYVDINQSAEHLYSRFLPGPVTVISNSKNKVAKNVASEMGTLGIRISSHPLAMAMVKAFKKPITATSANASWQKKPYSIEDILLPLSDRQKFKLDLAIDAGTLPKKETSTVIDTTLVETMVLRKGDLKFGNKLVEFLSRSEDDTQKMAQTLMLKYWNQIRKKGLMIGLIGDLGSGKTVFAKGVGKFLKIGETITSPSYNLANEYKYSRFGVGGIFYHLDPWRLDSFEELLKIGLLNMLGKNNVTVIEWANKFSDQLKNYNKKNQVHYIEVGFETVDEQRRKLVIPD